MSGQSSSPPLLCASAANASLSPHPQHYTRLAAHLSLIPPHLRGAMAAYSALGQVGGSAHGQHHKIHHAGLAGCSAGGNGNDGPSSASSTSLGPNDACQETKSLTLDWKVSDLKTIFDSSRGDAKSRCIKSPLCR